ncbi:MAG: hypothetical protein ACXABY_25860 [Candidatus Thorarchaeota archaeon]|jgi:hypothetical protein
MAKAVVTLPQDQWRLIAREAGGDEKEIIWHPDTSELEVPGVTDTALGNAIVKISDGTSLVNVEDVTKKIERLSYSARYTIESGFQSTAGGLHTTQHWYDSSIEDQLNLVGNVETGDDTIHACRPTKTGQKAYINHTAGQLKQVLRDGRDRKLAILQEFATLKAQCLAAITKADLDAITWTMT